MGDAATARAHIAQAHAGKPSPDASNPAGYERVNGYECMLGEAAQAKFGLKREGGRG
jgi:hypothetical protein